jgi:ribosomal protein S18 acetylase RimI-like enzyme
VLVAELSARLIGCVALKPLQDGTAEMKRLYVEAAQRGAGVARQLVLELIERARALGYRRISLDTLPSMAGAQRLYGSLGFTEIQAYTYNPIPGARYLAFELNRTDAPCRDRA